MTSVLQSLYHIGKLTDAIYRMTNEEDVEVSGD